MKSLHESIRGNRLNVNICIYPCETRSLLSVLFHELKDYQLPYCLKSLIFIWRSFALWNKVCLASHTVPIYRLIFVCQIAFIFFCLLYFKDFVWHHVLGQICSNGAKLFLIFQDANAQSPGPPSHAAEVKSFIFHAWDGHEDQIKLNTVSNDISPIHVHPSHHKTWYLLIRMKRMRN